MAEKVHPSIPDFLIIGAGKSGTTSLNNYLKQHPQLFIPVRKEPNFYGYELKTVANFEGDDDEIRQFTRSITNFDDYLHLFDEAGENQLKGETSNTYLYHDDAPRRIQHYHPGMKLIAVLRQPAERLWSRYLHLARENKLPTPNFSDALDRSTIWWRRNDLVKEGFYYSNLSRFYEFFPASQIRVYLYEDLNIHGETVMKDIFDFLEVDQTFVPDLDVRLNPSGFIINKRLDGIIGSKGIIQESVKSLLSMKVYQGLKNNGVLQKLIGRMRTRNLARPRIDPEVKRMLTNEVYADEIKKLQKLIGKDLSHWLK